MDQRFDAPQECSALTVPKLAAVCRDIRNFLLQLRPLVKLIDGKVATAIAVEQSRLCRVVSLRTDDRFSIRNLKKLPHLDCLCQAPLRIAFPHG